MVILVQLSGHITDDEARDRALHSAEKLFCTRGIHAVRMEDVRDASGVSLYRLYRLYGSKAELALACMRRRDAALRERIRAAVESEPDPQARVLAIFDGLGEWFADEDFTGCPWINSYGEVGRNSPAIATEAMAHKASQRETLVTLVTDAGLPEETADTLMVLIEGATVCATFQGNPSPAQHARAAAEAIVGATIPV